MPAFPIVDTHLHLWDPGRLPYSWQPPGSPLNRSYRVEQYSADCANLQVEAMVFVECHIDDLPGRGRYIDEIEFAEEEASRDPRIAAIVAKAPLERGPAVAPLLEEIAIRFPRVRGIRRIPEFEPNPTAFMMSESFIEGVRLLSRYGLHFELNVNHTQMNGALEFVDRTPNVNIMLDHCGKPGIREGNLQEFRAHMRQFSRRPNVWCKLSDLPVEADRQTWSEADLRPYVEAALEAFGPKRIVYGGDWPVCLQATSLRRWVDVLDNTLSMLSGSELRMIYRDNACQFYRLKSLAPSTLARRPAGAP